MAKTLEGCHPEVKSRTELLLLEDTETENRLSLSEGKRTYAEQLVFYSKALIAHPLNPTAWAARPGTSNHERGVAVDIAAKDPVKDKAYRKAMAKKYGLKQTLPNEDWHFELDPKRKAVPLPTLKEVEKRVGKKAVKILPTVTGLGYWVVANDGGVFSYGDAQFYGSAGGAKIAAPICDADVTKTGNGYWLLGEDGGVFCFGDAQFYGTPAEKNVLGY